MVFLMVNEKVDTYQRSLSLLLVMVHLILIRKGYSFDRVTDVLKDSVTDIHLQKVNTKNSTSDG